MIYMMENIINETEQEAETNEKQKKKTREKKNRVLEIDCKFLSCSHTIKSNV